MDDSHESLQLALRLQLEELRQGDPEAIANGTQNNAEIADDGQTDAIDEWKKQISELSEKVQTDARDGQYDFYRKKFIKQQPPPADRPKKRKSAYIKLEGAESPTLDERGSPQLSSKRPRTSIECDVCFDTKPPTQVIQLLCCNTRYCRPCLNTLFHSNLTQQTLPQCCGQPLSPTFYTTHLPSQTVKQHQTLLLTQSTTNPIFCGISHCNAFIDTVHRKPLLNTEGDIIWCAKCHRFTCLFCKRPESDHRVTTVTPIHTTSGDQVTLEKRKTCPPGSEDTVLGGLVSKAGYKRCPHCQTVVEKSSGCNNMRCKCGKLFCYGCGDKLDREGGPCRCLGGRANYPPEDEHEGEDEDGNGEPAVPLTQQRADPMAVVRQLLERPRQRE